MIIKNDSIILQNASTTTGDGTEYMVKDESTLSFEITGSSSTRTIIFEGLLNDTWYSVQCFNPTTSDLASQTTGTGEVWIVDLTPWKKFRARISAISGGDVTIKGRTVS